MLYLFGFVAVSQKKNLVSIKVHSTGTLVRCPPQNAQLTSFGSIELELSTLVRAAPQQIPNEILFAL